MFYQNYELFEDFEDSTAEVCLTEELPQNYEEEDEFIDIYERDILPF